MLTVEQMLVRLGIAVLLGGIIGAEREFVGKAAGIRTEIMVAAGAAVFTIAGISLPYLITVDSAHLPDVIARNSGFLSLIGNIVVGVGFLGTGIIIHRGTQVLGLTTAATIWFVAAVGVLCGIGLFEFATVSAVGISILLFLLGKIGWAPH